MGEAALRCGGWADSILCSGKLLTVRLQEEAKKDKRRIWKEYDEEAELAAQATEEPESGALKAEYQDIIISDVRAHNGTFSVQILNTEGTLLILHLQPFRRC